MLGSAAGLPRSVSSCPICSVWERAALNGMLPVRANPWFFQSNPNLRGIPAKRASKEGAKKRWRMNAVSIRSFRNFAPSLLALLAGIPRRFGFDWKNHGFALTGSIPFSAARSQTLQIGQLLTLLGKPAADPSMEFRVSQEATRGAQELLARWGFDPAKRLVGIHPGGGETAIHSDAVKRWLPERFGRLANLLAQRGGVQVVLLQGPGDEPFVNEALKNMTARPLGVASGLPLTVFAALIRQCDLVVVNDTGPMHLAAAQKVPVVAIVGPTHPAYTLPRGEIHKVIWAGVHCSPCYHPEEYVFGTRQNGKKVFECWRSTHECMVAITAEEVYDVVVGQIRAFGNKPLGDQTQSPVELNS